jgi:recombination protein RecT
MATTAIQPAQQAAVAQRKDVRALLNSNAFMDQIKQAVPGHIKADIMVRVALTTIQKTPDLLACDQTSLLGSIVECAQLGLMPDGILGEAYLVPYKNTQANRRDCQLQIGWRGLIKLARQSGLVAYVVAEPVYQCDQFKVLYAPERTLEHIPNFEDETRGTYPAKGTQGVPNFIPIGFRGVYALVKYKTGEIDFEYLPLHRVEQIRAGSKAQNGPWLSHWLEMARKSAIRALGKRLPLTTDFMRAANLDDLREQGIETPETAADKNALGDAVLGALADNKAQELADKYIKKPEEEQPQDGQPQPPISAYSEDEARVADPSPTSLPQDDQQPEQASQGSHRKFSPFDDSPAPTTRGRR